MIENWEELGNEIAELKIDVSYLMNSQPNLLYIKEDIKTIKAHLIDCQKLPPVSKDILGSLHKTQVLMNDLQNRINKHIDTSKKRYKKYAKET